MKLSDADLREFAKIWQQEFGETISLEKAREHASLLLELYALLSKPLPSERLALSENNMPSK